MNDTKIRYLKISQPVCAAMLSCNMSLFTVSISLSRSFDPLLFDSRLDLTINGTTHKLRPIEGGVCVSKPLYN